MIAFLLAQIGKIKKAVSAQNDQMTYKTGDIITFPSDGSDYMYGFILQNNQIYVYMPLAKPVSASSFSVSFNEGAQLALKTITGSKTITVTGTTSRSIGKTDLQFAITIETMDFSGLANTPILCSTVGLAVTFS